MYQKMYECIYFNFFTFLFHRLPLKTIYKENVFFSITRCLYNSIFFGSSWFELLKFDCIWDISLFWIPTTLNLASKNIKRRFHSVIQFFFHVHVIKIENKKVSYDYVTCSYSLYNYRQILSTNRNLGIEQ